MAIITLSNKDIESSNLETQVSVAMQRYNLLEERVKSIESEIRKIEEEKTSNKRLLLSSIATIITGSIITLLATYINIHN